MGAKTRKTAEATEVIDLEWDGESKDRSRIKMPACQCQQDGRLPVFWHRKEERRLGRKHFKRSMAKTRAAAKQSRA